MINSYKEHAGVGAVRLRKDDGRLQGGCRAEISVLQLWGCDADPVTIIALRRCNIPTLYPQREHTPPAAGCTAVFRAQKGKILCLL